MRRFTPAVAAQRSVEAFSRVASLFRPPHHRLRAAAYRAVIGERAAAWRQETGRQAMRARLKQRAASWVGRERPQPLSGGGA
jgi:hypothetical protein